MTRASILVGAALLCVGCGGEAKKKEKTDIRKMSVGEACRTFIDQVKACKTAIDEAARASGPDLPEEVFTKLGEMSSEWRMDKCTSSMKPESDPLIACFDDDCKTFAGCLAPMLVDTFRPMERKQERGGPDQDKGGDKQGSTSTP